MFESPCKSINVLNAWSESQEELRETQPVSPRGTRKRVEAKQKKRKQQQSEKRSVSAPQLCTDDADKGRKEKKYRPDEPIERGIFQIGKKSHDVVLTETRVTWTPIQPETPTGEQRRGPRSVCRRLHGDYMLLLFTSCVSGARSHVSKPLIHVSCLQTRLHMQSQHWKSAR